MKPRLLGGVLFTLLQKYSGPSSAASHSRSTRLLSCVACRRAYATSYGKRGVRPRYYLCRNPPLSQNTASARHGASSIFYGAFLCRKSNISP